MELLFIGRHDQIIFTNQHQISLGLSIGQKKRMAEFVLLRTLTVLDPLTNILVHRFGPNTPCSLAWLAAGCNMCGGRSLWYRTDCGTIQTVLSPQVLSILMYPASCLTDLQL